MWGDGKDLQGSSGIETFTVFDDEKQCRGTSCFTRVLAFRSQRRVYQGGRRCVRSPYIKMEGGNAMMRAIQESRKCLKTSATFEPQCNGCDYITQLPDDLLVLILDKLPMKDAWATSILAKRWRNVWRYKKNIVFDCNCGKKTGNIVFEAAKHFMQGHLGKTIQQLSVSFRYNTYMRHSVSDWITSAFEKNAEEICIDLNGLEKKTKKRKHSDFHFVPDCEIQCSTLVKLTLKFMELPMLPTCISALKELYLEEVELATGAVAMITGNCPSLVLLSLTNCNVKSDLKIQISPKCHLLQLIINEALGKVDKSTDLYIHAPSVTTIEFSSALPRKKYFVEDMPVIDEVKFSLDQMCHNRRAVKVGHGGLLGRQFKCSFIGLLRAFQAANVICLTSWCIQVLGVEIMFLNELYPSAATHLVLEMGLRRVELIGLVYLLRACQGLKSLSIMMTEPEEFHFHDGLKSTYIDGSKYAILDFEGNKSYTAVEDLPNLEVVEFSNYSPGFELKKCSDGTFFTEEVRFFKGTECGLMAVSLLKEKAMNFRKAVYKSRKRRYAIDPLTYFFVRD